MRKASSAKVEPCHPELCANMPKIDNRYIDVENNSTADIDNLYTPKSDDQLILTSDYSKVGVNATLWAHVDGIFRVV